MNIVKPWKIKWNAKGYVVKCENKRNAKNSPWILGNLRIQETFYVIKNLQGANKMNSHWKKMSRKIICFGHGVSTWLNPIYQVPFAKLCSGQIRHFTNSPFVTFNSSISEIPHETFFSQKFQTFQKTLNSFTYKY